MISTALTSTQTKGVRILAGIVTRNRAEILPKALASLQAQRGVDPSMAVIDDDSTDGTAGVRSLFPRVEWRHQSPAIGFILGRNELMAQPGFDYFVSLDDDAWFFEGDEIYSAVQFLEKNPAVGAIAFDILSPDRPDPVARGGEQQVAMFIGCGHLLRLAAIREIGSYQIAPGYYGGEEKDLCLRLLDAGYVVVKLPGLHVWHDKTLVNRDMEGQHRSGVCNDLVMTLQRTPALMLPMALAAKFYRHSKFSLRHGLVGACMSGFGLFIRSLPTVIKSRHPVKMETLRRFIRLTR